MQLLLNATKITPPRLPPILPRPRLLARLEQHQDRKLILILGPAAQGKTTLAATYAQQSPFLSAWLNLGPEDSESVNIFYLLGQSLQKTFPEVDFSMALAYPSMSMGPREELPLYRHWLLELFKPLPEPVQIVFDGLDRLISQAPALRLLQVLLEVAPPYLHLFLLSREQPPLEIEDLKMRQESFLLDGRDLAFTLKETRTFLADIRGFGLSAELVKAIFQVTEGWIGGMILLSEALERLPPETRESSLLDDLRRKFSRDICPYFSEQVFSSHPPQVQEVLLSSAILDNVEPDFLKDLVGRDDARDILEELARKNLFIQSAFDNNRGWLYRYHQLFRDFLLRKFTTDRGEEARRAVYLRAGELSEQRGELEHAVKYYLKAGSCPKAAAALVKVGLDLIMAGRTGDLTQWLADLPDEIIRDNPWLLLYRYASVRFTGPPEIISDLQRALTLFQGQRDVRGAMLALAFLLEAAIFRGHKNLGSLHAILEQGEALGRSEGAQPYPLERALLFSNLGLAFYLRGGAPLKSAWACRQAYLLAQDLGNVFLQTLALIHEYGSLKPLGEFSSLENLAEKVDRLLEEFFLPELHNYHLITLCQAYIWQGELVKAAKTLEQAREEIEQQGLTYFYPAALMCELWLKAYLEEEQDTERIGNTLTNITLNMGNLFMHGIGLMFWGKSRYQRGDYRRAQEVLRQAREVLASDAARAEIQWRWTKIMLALTAYHLQENGSAQRELEEALEYFNQISSHLFLREVHLALALFLWPQGQVTEAALHLEAGLKLGENHGFHFSFILNKPDMLQVCLMALELGLEETWDYVSHVMKTRLVELAGPELEKLGDHADRHVAEWALEVRQAIHRAGLPRLRLQTLGGFCLWRGEEEVEEKEWEGQQPKLLLKALLARGATQVHRDLLIEDLWPETSPDAGKQKFKVNLHRLRKTLEPSPDKTFGSSYLHLHRNLLSLDLELCEIDMLGFLSSYQEGVSQEKQGRLREAMSSYSEAMTRYTGEFLAHEPYAPWAANSRDQMHQAYCDLLARMTELLEKRGTLGKAIGMSQKLLQADPLREDAYRRLMLLQARRGRYSEALRTYEKCRQALKDELNVGPDELTTAIYRKILESSKSF
jgi:LuxR family transcriptional regulator, maltose regulon positive regulatory protein